MKVAFAGSLVLPCLALLTACSNEPEVPVRTGSACQSMEPMLAALPERKNIFGVPLTYKGCTGDEGVVGAMYETADKSKSYFYIISALNHDSPYTKSFHGQPANMVGGDMDLFVETIKLHRSQYDNRWKDCKAEFGAPAVDGRKPMIFRVKEFAVCIQGQSIPGGRRLVTFAVLDDFAYELIQEEKGESLDIGLVEALKAVDPVFGQFNPTVLK
jgi:hypothetical protein